MIPAVAVPLAADLLKQRKAAEARSVLDGLGPMLGQDADALYLRAEAERALGGEVVTWLNRALARAPAHTAALHLMGEIKREQGDWGAAAAAFQRALDTNPGFIAPAVGLALCLSRLGEVERSERLFTQLTATHPDQATLWQSWTAARLERGADAAVPARRAAELHPDHADIQYNLGLAADDEAAFIRALDLSPGHPGACAQLIRSARKRGAYAEALHWAAQAEAGPGSAELSINLASLYRELCDWPRAIQLLQQARRQDPKHRLAPQNQYYFLSYHAPERINARREAAHAFAALLPRSEQSLPRSQDTPRRIGLIGGCFRRHPAAHSVLSWLRAERDGPFSFTLFDRHPAEDPVAQELRTLAEHHVDCSAMGEVETCRAVRRAKIEVLIDLAWMSEDGALGVFARRAAPLQLTWLHAQGFTGTPGVDAQISDIHMYPPGGPEPELEPVLRLPRFSATAAFDQDAPPPRPRPDGSPPIFGAFNAHWKLSDQAARLWAEILRRVPDARLKIKSFGLDDPAAQEAVSALLARSGLDLERVVFCGHLPLIEHWQAFHDIDVMLDALPFTGGGGIMDSLWMGVPMITRVGAHPGERLSLAHLIEAGCEDWAAFSDAEYIDKAVAVIRDREGLTELRNSLRDRVAISDLSDGKALSRGLNTAILTAWRQCRGTVGKAG